MTKPPIPDADETRAGFRSGEGTDSVLRHLMAAARRMKKRRNEVPDSRGPSQDSEGGDGGVDIPLPP
jgi:hypothetical protein